MRTVRLTISILLPLLAGVNTVGAQQQHEVPQPPGAVVGTPITGQAGMGPAGYGSMFSVIQKAAAAQSGEPGYPMFEIFGPEHRASFWKDPEAAGNALILQGELMTKMGEAMIKNGRELLEKAKKRP